MYKTITTPADMDWLEITVEGFTLQLTLKDIQKKTLASVVIY